MGKIIYTAILNLTIGAGVFFIMANLIDAFGYYGTRGPFKGQGILLTLVISLLVAFNVDIRRLYSSSENLDKTLILLSILWLILSSSYSVLFLDYRLDDFFGREASDGTSLLLYPILILIIGRWFYKIYKDSL